MSTTYTPNYHLGKQTDTSDTFDMSVITDDMDIIDTILKEHDTEIDSILPYIYDSEEKTGTLTYSDLQWENGYLNSSGNVVPHDYYRTSQLIELGSGSTIVYDGLRSANSGNAMIAVYDETKTYNHNISLLGDGTVQSGTFNIPNGAKYVRFVTYNAGTPKLEGVTLSYIVISAIISNLEEEITNIDDRVTELESNSRTFTYTTAFDDYESVSGYLTTIDGAVAYTNGETTDYISTENIISIGVSEKMVRLAVDKIVCVIACFDANKNLLAQKSLLASDGNYGDIITVTGTITITDDIKYIKLSRATNYKDTASWSILNTRSFADDYIVEKEFVEELSKEIGKQWEGKKWYSFGTSITDMFYPNPEDDDKPTGKYYKYLEAVSGLKMATYKYSEGTHNYGVAGGTISDATTQYGTGNGAILAKIEDTDISDADLVTIEGFVNDYADCIPIGNITDTTSDTFCGALYLAITHVLTHSNATVIILTDSVGKQYTMTTSEVTVDYRNSKTNRIGLLQNDYIDASIRMAKYMGIHYIDCGRKSQINQCHPEYIVDQIHHTELGGEQYALTIWEELKTIHCNTDIAQ